MILFSQSFEKIPNTIAGNQLIAVYSGYLLDNDREVYFDNMTIDEREDVHKNWLYYNSSYMIDVPPFATKLTQYRASLGHKVSFS